MLSVLSTVANSSCTWNSTLAMAKNGGQGLRYFAKGLKDDAGDLFDLLRLFLEARAGSPSRHDRVRSRQRFRQASGGAATDGVAAPSVRSCARTGAVLARDACSSRRRTLSRESRLEHRNRETDE